GSFRPVHSHSRFRRTALTVRPEPLDLVQPCRTVEQRALQSPAAWATSGFSICVRIACASASVNSCVLFEWFIEQNFGPHIEQNAASLKPSSGSVSSCIERAVSGSSDSSNWRFQSKL